MSAGEAEARLTLAVGERDHVQGADHAALTLLEYGDYQCPYCGEAYPIVREVQRRLGPRLRFVFRNFPLGNMHPNAPLAAEAAEAAGAQGKFWEMHDMLYENQAALTEPDLVAYAKALRLDTSRFQADLVNHRFRARVQEDFMSGVRSGVNGTPTFYINGLRHDGSYDLTELIGALEAAHPLAPTSGGAAPRTTSVRRRSPV
jgi:protein-disulfide isomerase